MEEFTKKTQRKLVSYQDIDALINNNMNEPAMKNNASIKTIKAKQKVWRLRTMAQNHRDSSKKKQYT